jgi:hypothetical protein
MVSKQVHVGGSFKDRGPRNYWSGRYWYRLLGSVSFRSTEWSQHLVQNGRRRLDCGTIDAVGIDIDSVGFRDLQIDGMEPASRPNWPAAIVYIPHPPLFHLKVNQVLEILQAQVHILWRNTSEPQYYRSVLCMQMNCKLAVKRWSHQHTYNNQQRANIGHWNSCWNMLIGHHLQNFL